MYIPPLRDQVPKRGNRLTRGFCAWVLRLFGWRMQGEIPNLRKFVAVVAPHTTAWDLPLGLLTIFALGIRLTWMGADWIFRFPFLRALGGIPIDRSRSQGVVEQTAEAFRGADRMVLVLAPEGSRYKVEWKSGFFNIARLAGVPLLLIAPSYRERMLYFGPVVEIEPDETFEQLMDRIRPFFAPFVDEYPDRFQV